MNPRYAQAKIGFMQGRLSPMVNGKIQAFPKEHWVSEFAAAQELGIDRMEWTLDQEALYENPFMTSDGQKQILELMKKHHLTIPSLTGDCFMQSPFFKAGYDQTSLLRDLENVVKACGVLGVEVIVFPLVDNSSVTTAAETELLRSELLARQSLLKQYGVQIAFESDFAPADLAKFIALFPAESFGVNYDVGNSASLGFIPAEEFAAYGARIINVHIKDRPRGGTTVPLGQGAADFPQVFENLQKISYRRNLILQTARSQDGQHKEFVRRFADFVIERHAL